MSIREYGTERKAPNRKERAVAKGILKGIDVWRLKQAIARAGRGRPTSDGRTYRLGMNIAEFTWFLIFRDGQGEAGDEIHATARQVEEETGITPRMQQRVRRVMAEEGMVEHRVDRRRSDGQRTVFYRLDLWQVARVVVKSELKNVRAILEHEGRRKERDRLEGEIRKLEQALADLDLIEVAGDALLPAPEQPQGGVMTSCSDGDNKLGQLHTTSHTPGMTVLPDGNTVVCDLQKSKVNGSWKPETEEAMRTIYSRLKRAGIEVPRWQYAAIQCEVERGEIPAGRSQAALLAELLVEHHEETGKVDYLLAMAGLASPDEVVDPVVQGTWEEEF